MNQEEIDAGRTFPHINRIREVATEVALAVIEEAMAIDSCTKFMPWHMAAIEKDGLRKFVEGKMYYPEYTPIVPK